MQTAKNTPMPISISNNIKKYYGNLLFHQIKISETSDRIHLIIPFSFYYLMPDGYLSSIKNISCSNISKEEIDDIFDRLTRAVVNHLFQKYHSRKNHPYIANAQEIIVKNTGISSGNFHAFHLEIQKSQMYLLPENWLRKIGKP